MISATLVKQLREKTGAGMMDCKKALTETNGDMDAAIDWLREKGISKAQKKADRIAAEGLCEVTVKGNKAYIFELNSETDFVAKNEKFIAVLEKIGALCAENDAKSAEEALNASLNGETGNEIIINATATIGEKISLRRVECVEKTDAESFGVYKHMGGKIAVVSVVTGDNEVLAKDVCMHVAAINPRFLDRTAVDADTIAHERKVLTQEALNEGKPAAIVEKMVEGRIQKFLKEICLVDQPFVKNPDETVGQHAKSLNSQVCKFVRYEVGEGMEKRNDNFAEEVAAQAAKAAQANK